MDYAIFVLTTLFGAGIGIAVGYAARDVKGKHMIGTAESKAAEI